MPNHVARVAQVLELHAGSQEMHIGRPSCPTAAWVRIMLEVFDSIIPSSFGFLPTADGSTPNFRREASTQTSCHLGQ